MIGKSALILCIWLLLVSGCADRQPKLRVVMGLGESEWRVMRREIFPPFEKMSGFRIDAVQLEAADLPHVLEAQAGAGRVNIDLFAQDNMQLSRLVSSGLVKDLSPYRSSVPQEVVPALVRAGEFDGKLYFLPFRPNVQITYYNKAKFDLYGLEPPKNWDELLKAARTFKEKEGTGKVLFKAYGGAPTATQLYEWIVSAGGDPLSLNDKGCVRTFTFLKKLWPYTSPDSIRAKFDTSNEYLARDSAYLMQNWPFGVRIIMEEYGKEVISTYSGFSGPVREAHVVGGDVLGIPKGAPNKEGALRFIEYLQSRPVQEKLAAELGWPSIRSDAYGSVPEWMRPHFGSVTRALEHGVFRPNVHYWPDFERYINDAFSEIVIRGKPVKGTLDKYRRRLDLARQRT